MRPRCRRWEEMHPRRSRTPLIGEERGAGLEPYEDQVGEVAENRVGDIGDGVLLLHDELHAPSRQ